MITDPNDRALLEQQYNQLLSSLVLLARLLGKPCPVVTRKERRHVDTCVDNSAILSLGGPDAPLSNDTHGLKQGGALAGPDAV